MFFKNIMLCGILTVVFSLNGVIANAEESKDISAKEELYIQQKQDIKRDIKVVKYSNEDLFKMEKENNILFVQDKYNNKFYVHLKKENIKQEISETDAIYLGYLGGELDNVERIRKEEMSSKTVNATETDESTLLRVLISITGTIAVLLGLVMYLSGRLLKKRNS